MTKLATCKFWVASRQRFCKFLISKDSDEYCAVHDSGSGDKARIPCPIDPKHMIFKKDTEKHVLKCSRVVDNLFSSQQPFTNKGCNVNLLSETESSTDAEIPAFSELELVNLRSTLFDAREELAKLIQSRSLCVEIPSESTVFSEGWSDVVESCVSSMLGSGWSSREEIDKHNLQNASLLEVLRENDITPSLDSEKVYVELGCGKAGLSKWLMYSIDSVPETPTETPVFLLLDYEARRHKQENKREIQDKVSPQSVIRLRSDIRDVDLLEFLTPKSVQEIPDLQGKVGSPERRLSELNRKVTTIQSRPNWPYKEVIGFAKHLCGAATDFGLRCLERVKNRKVSIVFATCCHHRCDWTQLVGREVLVSLNVCSTASQFKRIISLAGWATTEGIAEEKRVIGRLVKSVIDLTRVLWLVNTFGGIEKIEYRKYIQDGITPENFCIVLKAR